MMIIIDHRRQTGYILDQVDSCHWVKIPYAQMLARFYQATKLFRATSGIQIVAPIFYNNKGTLQICPL